MKIEALLAEAEHYESQMPSEEAETIQHLMELGYLLNNAPTLASTLEKALEKFLRDFQDQRLVSQGEFLKLRSTYGHSLEVLLLRECTDIDEGFRFTSMPDFGEVSLKSRIILYRLALFGLWDGQPDSPYSEVVSLKIGSLKKYGRYIEAIEACNALADIEKFSKRILHIWGDENALIAFHIPDDTNEKDVSGAFKRRFRKDFGKREKFADRIEQFLLNAAPEHIDYQYLSARATTDINRFILRVIQVHQWTEGEYNGKLDGDWGNVTLESLKQTIELYNEDEARDVRTKEVLAPMGKGHYLFNALFFLRHYMIEEGVDQTEGVLDSLTTQAQNASKEELETFKTNTQKLLDTTLSENQLEQVQVKMGLFKRVYFGFKKFFKKLFRFGKKLFKWIVNKFEKLFSYLKDFFKKILQIAKTAIRSMINGIRYILGKLPIISVSAENKYLITKFQIDGDGISILPSGKKDLSAHQKLMDTRVAELSFSLALVGELISLMKYIV